MREASLLLAALVVVAGLGCSDLDRARLKAHLGGDDSQLELARRYSEGNGVEKDAEASTRWYLRAAEGGHSGAMVVVGNRLAVGEGAEQDPELAVAWYRRAARAGDPNGEVALALMLLNGSGVEQNTAAGLTLLRKASAKGHPDALRILRQLTRQSQDPAELLARDREDAEAGDPQAQSALGTAYLLGRGVEADPAEGVRWLEKAAEQDEPGALAMLGTVYSRGLGRPAETTGIDGTQHRQGPGLVLLGRLLEPAHALRGIRLHAAPEQVGRAERGLRLGVTGFGVLAIARQQLCRVLRLPRQLPEDSQRVGVALGGGLPQQREPGGGVLLDPAAVEQHERQRHLAVRVARPRGSPVPGHGQLGILLRPFAHGETIAHHHHGTAVAALGRAEIPAGGRLRVLFDAVALRVASGELEL